MDLARDHGLVHGGPALQHHAVHGHAVARAGRAGDRRLRPRPSAISSRRRRPGAAVRSSARGRAAPGWRRPVCSRARSSSTCPSSTSTVMTAAASKYTATVPSMPRNAGREERRGSGGDHAVEPGRARAERDQREHVEVAVDQRRPAALEERPPCPQHHGRCSSELDPDRDPAARRDAGRAPGCGRPSPATNTGTRQHQPDPEPPGHVDSSGLGPASAVTITGSSAMPQIGQLPGVSGGFPGASGRCRWCPSRPGAGGGVLGVQVSLWVGLELRLAAGRAEVEEPPAVFGPMCGGRRIDLHAADRVGNQGGAVRRRSGLAVVMPRRGGRLRWSAGRSLMSSPVWPPASARAGLLSRQLKRWGFPTWGRSRSAAVAERVAPCEIMEADRGRYIGGDLPEMPKGMENSGG